MPPPGFGLNEFQERSSGAYRMPENLSPRTPVRELTASPASPGWWKWGWLSLPQEPHLCCRPFGPGWPLPEIVGLTPASCIPTQVSNIYSLLTSTLWENA